MIILPINNIDFDNIEIISMPLHSGCNLMCPYCPRFVMKGLPHERVFTPKDTIDFFIEHVVKKCKNLKVLNMSAINQPIMEIEDVVLHNEMIDRIKSIHPGIKVKICSNMVVTSKYKFEDILKLKCDVIHLSKHKKNELWVDDFIDKIDTMNVSYNIYMNKKTNKIAIVEIDNKKYIFHPNYEEFDGVKLDEYKKIIEKFDYPIVNIHNKMDFINHVSNEGQEHCKMNILKIDFQGYIFPCICSGSLINKDLAYGRIIDGEYIETKIRDFTDCNYCQLPKFTDSSIDINLNKYAKFEIHKEK